jgi:uroporphyrinogen III methyltransferase/synthase
LIPRASNARDLLPRELEKMGAKVDVVCAYRNVIPEIEEQKREKLKDMLLKGEAEVVIFTSPSTFHNFLKLLDISENRVKEYFKITKIACIGPVTASAIEKKGLRPDITPEKYDIPHLVKAIISNCRVKN